MIPARVDLPDGTSKLIRADANVKAYCPECHGDVTARFPEHAIRHWAHKPLPDGQVRDCSRDAGEMSVWHREWQDRRTDLERIEVRSEDGSHRADTINEAGIVVEFQKSSIDADAARQREVAWGRGVWVLDGTGVREDGDPHISIRRKPEQDPDDPWRTWRWPHGHRLLFTAKWHKWIDLGPEKGLLQVYWTDPKEKRGTGFLVAHDWFVEHVLNGKQMLYKSAPAPRSTTGPRRKRGQARAEADEDLTGITVDCSRTPAPHGAVAAALARRAITGVILDWGDSKHWNRTGDARCSHCGQPTPLLDDAGMSSHKICAEAWHEP